MHLDDFFQAYFDCRRRKRRTPEALLWEQNFEKNCLQLHREIIAGSYQPDNYKLIYVTDPVMREIFVPTFRDRVVHHLLANWLRPKLEKLFIHDNYAGREGRGTLFGIRRAEKFMRQVTQNYQKPAYVLKLDIASYFRSIPKERLWERVVSVIARSEKGASLTSSDEAIHDSDTDIWIASQARDDGIPSFQNFERNKVEGEICGIQDISTRSEQYFSQTEKDLIFHLDSGSNISLLTQGKYPSGMTESERERERVLINLLKAVIFHDPRKHFSGTINPDFPKHKSLFSTSPDKSLPLGDLVSQLLGNFYLHELDHFVKYELYIKHYGRYMDDMIFFHPDREVLENVTTHIRDFLREKHKLELHEGKIVLNSCEQGILLLGAYIKPWRTYIGNRTKKNMYERIVKRDEERFEAQMQSYLGLMGHFQTGRLQKKIESMVCE